MCNILVLANYESPHLKPWIKIYERLKDFNFYFIYGHYTSSNENFKNIFYEKSINIFSLRSLIKEYRIDIVHTHSAGKLGLLSLFLGKPTIVRIYGTELFAIEHNIFRKILMRLVLTKASRVGASSPFTKEFIGDNFNKKLYDKTGFYAFPASDKFFKFNLTAVHKNTILKKYSKYVDIKPDTKIFFINRRVGELYNSNRVVKTFKQYLKLNPNCYLIVMNSYTIDHQELNLVKESIGKDDSRFIFINSPIDPTDLNEIYNASNLFISIPKTDQFSLSILEGIKAGCVPLISNTKSYSFLIKNYKFPNVNIDINLETELLSIFKESDKLSFSGEAFNEKYGSLSSLIEDLRKHFLKAINE